MPRDRLAVACRWMLAFAPALLLAACGTSAHVDSSQNLQPDAALLGLGEVCSSSPQCASGFCLLLGPNAQSAPGQCSLACGTDPECGNEGLCRTEPVAADGGRSGLDAGACFKACAAGSDCAPGIPCVWQIARDAGFCQTLNDSATLCSEIGAATSDACIACLVKADTGCCVQVAACVADVPCAKLETCSGTCASTWQSSGIPTAQAVGACAAAKCPACQ
jgi:hypothetical protein